MGYELLYEPLKFSTASTYLFYVCIFISMLYCITFPYESFTKLKKERSGSKIILKILFIVMFVFMIFALGDLFDENFKYKENGRFKTETDFFILLWFGLAGIPFTLGYIIGLLWWIIRCSLEKFEIKTGMLCYKKSKVCYNILMIIFAPIYPFASFIKAIIIKNKKLQNLFLENSYFVKREGL